MTEKSRLLDLSDPSGATLHAKGSGTKGYFNISAAPEKLANTVGRMTKTGVDLTQQLASTVKKLTPDQLGQIAQQLNTGVQNAENAKITQYIKKAIENQNDSTARNAALFAAMQSPTFRAIVSTIVPGGE